MKLVTYDDGTNNEIAGILTPDETGVVQLASIDPSVTSLQTFIEAAEGGAMAPVNAQLEQTSTATLLTHVRLLAPLPRPV